MKAFAKVPHCGLLDKLSMYGLGQTYIKWFERFLFNRQQRVIVNGQSLEWKPARSEIPQGSVMGQVLFVQYINDLQASLKN